MELSVRHWTPRGREVGTMSADQIPYEPEVSLRPTLRFESDTIRDNRRYAAGWFADFRARWRADLELARVRFKARMEAL
jgi:hypothetical protein